MRSDHELFTRRLVERRLAGKADADHAHEIADVSGLQAALDAKAPAIGLVIENRTDDPASPATGQIWLRTDL